MPNYRQKNRKKNNKNRNKNSSSNNNNNNNNNNQNQSSSNENKSQEEISKEKQSTVSKKEAVTKVNKKLVYDQESPQVGNVSIDPSVAVVETTHHPTPITVNEKIDNASVSAATCSGAASKVATLVEDDDNQQCSNANDTVSNKKAKQSDVKLLKQASKVTNAKEIIINFCDLLKMGAKNTKELPKEPTKDVLDDDNDNCTDQKIENEPKTTQQVKVIIQTIVPAKSEPKVILHPIALEEEPDDLDEESDCSNKQHDYLVQSPVSNDSSGEINDHQSKSTTFQIQEVLSDATISSDEAAEQNAPIISEMLSDLESQVTNPPAFNINALTTTFTDAEKTPEYDDLKMKRAQKRAALESHFLPQLLSPRYLDSILEENSDMSDARSDCSDRRSTELGNHDVKVPKVNAKFPRSSLDFSKKHKSGNTLPSLQFAICEEPLALMVETKLIDHLQNVAEEACSTQSTLHLEPQVEAAEVVFINSSTSSSTSDLMDLEEEENQEEECLKTRETVDLDTDANAIIMKPTENSEREVTPVNQISTSLKCDLTAENIAENIENEQNSIAISATIVETNYEGAAINNAISNVNTSKDTTSGEEENEQLVLSENSSNNLDTSSLSSVSLSSGHESTLTTTSEPPNTTSTTKTADLIQSSSYDDDIDDSSLVPASSSNCSSTIDASPSLSLKSLVEEVEENSEEAFARLENTCREIMDNVRDIVYANSESTVNDKMSVTDTHKIKPLSSSSSSFSAHLTEIDRKALQINGKQLSPPPPPIPPPSREHAYECNESAKNYVQDTNSFALLTNTPQQSSLKSIGTLERQESLESHCSSNSTNHSQCTAINLNDRGEYDVSSPIFSDNETNAGTNRVSMTATPTQAEIMSRTSQSNNSMESIQKLRQLCTNKLAALPYGEQVLEELATIAQNIGEVKAAKILQVGETPNNLHANVHDLQSSLNIRKHTLQQQQEQAEQLHNTENEREIVHKVLLDDQRLLNSVHGIPFVKTINTLEQPREEIKKLLRKSLSPPPIPPPPVPMKSSETAAKAQQQQKQQQQQQHQNNSIVNSRTIPIVFEENDVSVKHLNTKEQLKTNTFSMNGKEDSRQQILINDDIITNKPQQYEQEKCTIIKINANSETASNNKTSSFENSSRQKKTDDIESANTSEKYQQVYSTSSQSKSNSSSSSSKQQFKEENTQKYFPNSKEPNNEQPRPFGEMQGVESELGRMFPSMGDTNIFDGQQKRFSNIENTSSFAPIIKSEQPKRYSNIETHSFESQKRLENGQVVYDYEDSRHELQKETSDEVDAAAKAHINVKTDDMKDTNHVVRENNIENNQQNIRSAFNLNEKMNNEEFGQNAKSYETLKTAPLAKNFATETATETESKTTKTSTSTTTNRIDQEKLFKDFDDLSQQLHRELETGRVQREQREKSSSLYDLNRNHQQHLEDLKRQRHEHMRELEREIERSMKSRQFSRGVSQESTFSKQSPHDHKTYEIPVHIENGHSRPKTHEIPIRIENEYGENARSHFEHDDKNSPFRRAESMYDLEQNARSPYPQTETHSRPRTASSNYESQQVISDDWSQYASDLGSSENISRPIAREMQICYQRQQPRTIRAPRLTVSTNDLSASLAPPTYDSHNAYNVRRSQAPMMQQVPATSQQNQNQYSSCYSVLERDPNPTYIGTTSRRGVSPAPPPVQKDQQNMSFNYKPLAQPRRASLPREIHEQQLKYICSKEEELRMEFERLQNERRRLLGELHKETQESTQQQQQQQHSAEIKSGEPQVPPRMTRDIYRPARLPTLSEDEVFRQQMAEEWLSKVAEREERRLQKIIKISKLHEEHNLDKLADEHIGLSASQPDLGQEFLHRVKERRHKLHMPADSDWESGAESQPGPPGHFSETDEGAANVKIISGKSVADVHALPSHLREFARLSNQHTEQLENGGKRHVYQEEESSREAMPNSSSSANKKSSVVKTVKISRQPPQVLAPGQGTTRHSYYQSKELFGSRQETQKMVFHPIQSILQHNDFDKQSHESMSPKVKTRKKTRFLLEPMHRRSWSESDLLREIDKELKLAKGFLFADGIWTPKHQSSSLYELNNIRSGFNSTTTTPPPIPANPIWTPQPSPATSRKQFRPVRFESPILPRRYVTQQSAPTSNTNGTFALNNGEQFASSPHSVTSCTDFSTTSTQLHNNDSTSCVSSPNAGPSASVSDKIKTFERSASSTETTRPFVRSQQNINRPFCKPNEVLYKLKHEYLSEPESEYEHPKKMAQLSRREVDGIGPVTKDGMPIVLRSEVKAPHQHEWYKQLYQTIHKQKKRDDYVIRYKCTKGRPYKSSGYQSEPEPNYDSDYSIKYRTLDRRRLQSCSSNVNLRNKTNFYPDDSCYGTLPNSVKSSQTLYKNQPGRIENYVTGHSSISEKEKREWWDEVMDIFNGHLDQTKVSPRYAEGNLSRALAKDSGYTSDSNLVFRKKEIPRASHLSPVEQKQVYKSVQAGGEPPLFGFRKAAPEKSKDLDYAPSIPPPPQAAPGGLYAPNGAQPESPNRYFESDVNIHFKTPVRNEFKAPLSEEELAIRQAEHMQKLYQEERRRKYLQELHDMNSRRHTDNFSPSQKSPIPLNRYDDFQADLAPKSPNIANKLKMVVRALYNFQGQNARELNFKKGDIIFVRRQIDKNWYEGEFNAMIGLFPANYVEILSKDVGGGGGVRQPPKRPSEGQARAKYNFQAQSGVELSLHKGELIALTRRVDDNWFEGRIANRKGIFPVAYVEVLTDIGAEDIAAKTVLPEYKPNLDALRTEVNNEFNHITRNGHQPPNGILKETKHLQKTDLLHVDTHSEPIAYRALYKYRPQNSDELELLEGDTVHVLEKCDDGWFVGTSQRTGCFGTFPGNYVERL